ncbi:MAG: hypothetical protein ACKO26_04570, partial [Planctomycetota bacterium]
MAGRWFAVAAAWAVACAGPAWGQADPARLTLDRIFVSGDFRPGGDHGGTWLDKATFARSDASATIKGFSDIVAEDARTGAKKVLVPAEKMVPPGAKDPVR